jgi:hypothetical protein
MNACITRALANLASGAFLSFLAFVTLAAAGVAFGTLAGGAFGT